MRIEVFINWHELTNVHPGLYETYIMGRIRDAGIPISGLLTFGGVKSGTLHWYDTWKGRQFIWVEKSLTNEGS